MHGSCVGFGKEVPDQNKSWEIFSCLVCTYRLHWIGGVPVVWRKRNLCLQHPCQKYIWFFFQKMNCQWRWLWLHFHECTVRPILLRTNKAKISRRILLFEAEVQPSPQFHFRNSSDLNSELVKLLISMNTYVDIREIWYSYWK